MQPKKNPQQEGAAIRPLRSNGKSTDPSKSDSYWFKTAPPRPAKSFSRKGGKWGNPNMRRPIFMKLLLAATTALSTSGLAVAAPQASPPAIFNWTGFYVGGHVGYGWTETDHHSQFFNNLGNPDPARAADGRGSGFLGGVQAGYNWQSGNLLLGLEADASLSGIKTDKRVNADLEYQSRMRWLVTATARAGLVQGDLLTYIKGGAAFSDIGLTTLVEDDPLKKGGTRTGWTLGAGFERVFASNWSAKAEYNFIRFGDESTSSFFAAAPGTVVHGFSQTIHLVKIGATYRFGSPR